MRAIGIIPARLQSTRLSEKVLRPIAGKPMIQHVWERAKRASLLDEVIVACDDAKVAECVKGFGGISILTRADHPNGSSRAGEVVSARGEEIVVNIQGDEPLIAPENIDCLVTVLRGDASLQVATLAVRKTDRTEYEDPNVVKVMCAANGNALTFSRSPLPYFRQGTETPFSYLKHLGIYAYRREFLLQFVQWPKGNLEETEKLEQLRILENGIPIRVLETEHDAPSVDTLEDLQHIETIMSGTTQRAPGPDDSESSERRVAYA